MRAVDTNVLVRLFMRDDAAQTDVVEDFIERGAWVSHVVLLEMAWTLRTTYELEHADIARIIAMLLEHRQLVLQDPDVIAAALDHDHRKPALGFADCLILEIARKAGHLPLGTFDKALGRLDGAERL